MKNAMMISMDLENVVGRGVLVATPNPGVNGPVISLSGETYIRPLRTDQAVRSGTTYFGQIYQVSVSFIIVYNINIDPNTGKHR
jgi:hypothetical protein